MILVLLWLVEVPNSGLTSSGTLAPVMLAILKEAMDDLQAPPIGTRGTVIGVDDTASIMVAWDNGSGLNVVYGEDRCRKIEE